MKDRDKASRRKQPGGNKDQPLEEDFKNKQSQLTSWRELEMRPGCYKNDQRTKKELLKIQNMIAERKTETEELEGKVRKCHRMQNKKIKQADRKKKDKKIRGTIQKVQYPRQEVFQKKRKLRRGSNK